MIQLHLELPILKTANVVDIQLGSHSLLLTLPAVAYSHVGDFLYFSAKEAPQPVSVVDPRNKD